MQDARLDSLLTTFEIALEGISSEEEARGVILNFNRAAGLTGRTDEKSIPMINGAVIPTSVWQAYRPRVEALRTRLEARAIAFAKAAMTSMKERHTVDLRLHFKAELIPSPDLRPEDEERPVEDPSVLALLDGKSSDTFFEDSLDFSGTPALRLPIRATIHFEREEGRLSVVIPIPLERKPNQDEADRIATIVYQSMDVGWGINYDFDLPEELDEYNFYFERTPTHFDLREV